MVQYKVVNMWFEIMKAETWNNCNMFPQQYTCNTDIYIFHLTHVLLKDVTLK